MKGWVFNIQKFSLHDGPGIRDLVFLKGCPLKCEWCANPESQVADPGVLLKVKQCLGFDACGLCEPACPSGAIFKDREGRAAINWDVCTHCAHCATICPSMALTAVGREMTVDEVLAVVEKDGGFHSRSGGGVTISGGEPLMQADFAVALLSACRAQLIDTALETSGFGSWEKLEKMADAANMIHYDIKSMDDDVHRRFTGVSNKLITENLVRLTRRFPRKKIIVRTPVIPGFNDTREDISEIVAFLKSIDADVEYHLMPFHRLGFSKYACLGRTCAFEDCPPVPEPLMEGLNGLADYMNG